MNAVRLYRASCPAVHRWKHPTELFRYILFLCTRFRDNAVIELSSDKPAETCLQIRIPGFAKKATVNGIEACPGTYFEQNILVDGRNMRYGGADL